MKKTNTVLDKILENKAKEILKAKKKISLEELQQNLSKRKTKIRDFTAALKSKNGMSLIAEIKKASPSKGVLKNEFNPSAIAQTYQKSGVVDAISVLTDNKYFQGKLSFVKTIKKVTTIPILRKDFIIDEYQIYESYLAEADAILLIVAALEKNQLIHLMNIAGRLGLACLVEVHTQEELSIAFEVHAKIIGVNARDLKTLTIDGKLFNELLSDIPETIVKVAESGIKNSYDVEQSYKSGANAILVGSSIMETDNIEKKLQELKGVK